MKHSIHITPADYRKLADEELVRRHIELHEYTAFNALFERFGHIVYGICLSLHIGNATAARLKTEEIFILMLRDLRLFKVDEFKPWLYNYVIAHITGRKSDVSFSSTASVGTVDKYEAMPIPTAIEKGMSRLSAEEQQCIRLFYDGNKSFADISRETGLSLPALKRLLHSGKEHVYDQLAVSGQLAHIFDKSACLGRRQLKEYASGYMAAEECHAVEHHLNNCPLCSMAAEGMEVYPNEAPVQLAALSTRFLNDHFSITYPQVHISSFVTDNTAARHTKARNIPLWVHLLLGAIIVATIAVLFYAENHHLSISWK